MYVMWGKVRRGKGRGKKLGFPTANIALHRKISVGVYISQTKVEGNWHPSLTFIGAAKTFNETKVQAETYLSDYNQSLYGQTIVLKLLKRIRRNLKFKSQEELILQMRKDEKRARKYV